MIKYKSIEEEAEECRKAFVGHDYTISGPLVYAWHVHHEALAELLDEPIKNRIAYILSDKPEAEQAIRLRWMRPVLAPKPEEVVKAWGVWDKAKEVYFKVREACNEAEEVYDKAVEAYFDAWGVHNKAWKARSKAREDYIEAWWAYNKARNAWLTPELHNKELPGCPWDGYTIFPHEEVQKY